MSADSHPVYPLIQDAPHSSPITTTPAVNTVTPGLAVVEISRLLSALRFLFSRPGVAERLSSQRVPHYGVTTVPVPARSPKHIPQYRGFIIVPRYMCPPLHLALWGLMGPSQGCTLHRRLYVPPPALQALWFERSGGSDSESSHGFGRPRTPRGGALKLRRNTILPVYPIAIDQLLDLSTECLCFLELTWKFYRPTVGNFGQLGADASGHWSAPQNF